MCSGSSQNTNPGGQQRSQNTHSGGQQRSQNPNPSGQQRSQNTNPGDQQRTWQQLYPDLVQMFSGTPQDQQPAGPAPSFTTHIMNLLGLQPHHFQNHFNNFQDNFHNSFNNHGNPDHNDHPEPSAPPPPPPTPGFPPPPPTWQYPNHCNCNSRHQQPSPLSILLTPLLNFSTTLTKHLLTFFCLLLLILTIRLLPTSLLTSSLYLCLAAGLGLPLPTLLAGHILHCFVSMFDPFFACLVVVWALHKMFVRRRPLVDTQFWMRRWTNARLSPQFHTHSQ